MGFLNRYFRGDAVSDADYGAREAAAGDADKAPERLYRNSAGSVRAAQTQPVAQPVRNAKPAVQSGRADNVVEFARPRAATGTDGIQRSAAAFTRENAGFTREFGEGERGGASFGGGFGSTGSARANQAETAEAYVVFKRLKDFTMASQVADKMTERKIVILNLESCDDEVARRVLDFIGGVAYACGSMVKRIAGRVFMITPKGVSSDGEFFDEIRNGDVTINYED